MRLALGTAQLAAPYGIANRSGAISSGELDAILTYACANGIDTLDTAVAYGDAERRLGEAGVAGWRVVSKLPELPPDCRELGTWVQRTVAGSLARLRLDRMHGLLLHRPGQLLGEAGDALYRALVEVKEAGVVGKIGVSVYHPRELDEVLARYPVSLVQAPFNILDRRLVETGWLSELRTRGVEVHVRSVFLQGLLLMPPQSRPRKFDRWSEVWTRYDAFLGAAAKTPLQVCLGFALSFQEIDRVIVGVDNLDHLKAIVSAAEEPPVPVADAPRTDDVDLLNPARWMELRP